MSRHKLPPTLYILANAAQMETDSRSSIIHLVLIKYLSYRIGTKIILNELTARTVRSPVVRFYAHHTLAQPLTAEEMPKSAHPFRQSCKVSGLGPRYTVNILVSIQDMIYVHKDPKLETVIPMLSLLIYPNY